MLKNIQKKENSFFRKIFIVALIAQSNVLSGMSLVAKTAKNKQYEYVFYKEKPIRAPELPRDIVLHHLYPLIFNPDDYEVIEGSSGLRYRTFESYRENRLEDLSRFARTCKHLYKLKEEYIELHKFHDPYKEAQLLYDVPWIYSKRSTEQWRKKIYTKMQEIRNKKQAIVHDKNYKRDLYATLLTCICNNNGPNDKFHIRRDNILFTILLIIRFMRKHKYNLNKPLKKDGKDDDTPFLAAFYKYDIPIVRLLLQTGFDPDSKFKEESSYVSDKSNKWKTYSITYTHLSYCENDIQRYLFDGTHRQQEKENTGEIRKLMLKHQRKHKPIMYAMNRFLDLVGLKDGKKVDKRLVDYLGQSFKPR